MKKIVYIDQTLQHCKPVPYTDQITDFTLQLLVRTYFLIIIQYNYHDMCKHLQQPTSLGVFKSFYSFFNAFLIQFRQFFVQLFCDQYEEDVEYLLDSHSKCTPHKTKKKTKYILILIKLT